MAKILVVEDEPVSRGIVAAILERDGHVVVPCGGAEQAIGAMSAAEFDLLVSDIIMPGHDGFEVIQAARRLYPGMKVVVLSAIDERVPAELSTAAFERLGVDRFARKPVRPADLTATVRSVLATA